MSIVLIDYGLTQMGSVNALFALTSGEKLLGYRSIKLVSVIPFGAHSSYSHGHMDSALCLMC